MAVRIFNLQVRLPLVLLALIEGGLLLLAPHLVTWIGIGSFGDEIGTSSHPVLAGSIVFAIFGIASLIAVGLYSTRLRTDLTGVAVRVVAGISAAVVLSALVYYFLPSISIGRRTLFTAATIGIVASLAVRVFFERLFDDELFKRRVLVYGAGRRASTLLALRRRSDTRGFRLVAFMAAEGDELSVPDDRLVRRPPDLFRWAVEQQIDEVVVAMDDRRRDFPMEELLECRLSGIDVLELATFLERETGKVRLDVTNPSWIVLGEGFRESSLLQAIERTFDIVVSLVLLLPALPLMLVTAIAIRLEDGLRAPVLYRQSRVGRYNQPFQILKFRSMSQNAEEEGAVWALPRDPRITRVGVFIRSTRIDELPQLINVLRGDMSFVGPRPERPEFVDELAKSVPFYRSRHAVKPGITGWAQLCYPYGASDHDALEKLQYDLFYVKHRSLIFDLAIVLQTVEVVLWGKGSSLILPLGALSYGLAAAGFLILTILLLTSWEGRAAGARLIVASAVTSVWAALLALGADQSGLSAPFALLTEFLRYGAWIYVLTGLTGSAGMATLLSRLAHVAWISSIVALLAAPVLLSAGVPVLSPAALLASAGLLLALLGLLLLEQIYRNAREGGRYALKFLVIGLGLAFSYDLFLFSQAHLLRGIEPATWQARGLVTALTVPLIAIAARRNPQWSLNLFVSRHVVFYSASFLVVGIYLLLMAAGGYWVRLHGGDWGRVAQLVFVAGAAVVLLMVISSGSLRRRLRVFLNQHFYRNKYDYRLEWLRFVQTLSTPLEGVDARENAVRAMAQAINSPGGVLYLKSEDGEAFRSVTSWPASEVDTRRYPPLPSQDELVAFLRDRQWVIDLLELHASPDAYSNLIVPEALAGMPGQGPMRDRLIVPLTHLDTLIGFVVLAAPPPPFEPNYEDRDLLKMMGRHVAVHLAQYDADRRLAESRQFETYHRLTAFVMHDLRNLAAQLALIVSNAERHKRNPEFVDDAISTIANSTERMQRLIDQLQRREMQASTRRIALAEVARRACERCSARRPAPSCGGVVEDAWVDADPERLTMIVEHVIRNAQDATPEEGSVVLSVSFDGNGDTMESAVPMGETSQLRVPTAALTVSDSGSGMSAEFISERLFKPFDTTKGSKGMGIGAYQVREYVISLGGRIDVASRVGQGTRITLRIPLAAPPQET